VYEKGADMLIIWAGQNSLGRLSDEAKEYLTQKSCRIKCMGTYEAIRAWSKDGKNFIGLFHVTF
jgi:hypothetical protein